MTPRPESGFRRVAAIHSSWRGSLLLSTTNNALVHEEHRTRGAYAIDGRILTIDWADFPQEQFIEIDGVYIHVALLGQAMATTSQEAAE